MESSQEIKRKPMPMFMWSVLWKDELTSMGYRLNVNTGGRHVSLGRIEQQNFFTLICTARHIYIK